MSKSVLDSPLMQRAKVAYNEAAKAAQNRIEGYIPPMLAPLETCDRRALTVFGIAVPAVTRRTLSQTQVWMAENNLAVWGIEKFRPSELWQVPPDNDNVKRFPEYGYA
jgi:hypothetical protein